MVVSFGFLFGSLPPAQACTSSEGEEQPNRVSAFEGFRV